MLEVETVDYHTAGEPFRIVTAGAPDDSFRLSVVAGSHARRGRA